MITFEVPGPPAFKARHKQRWTGKFIQNYTPKATVNAEAHVKLYGAQAMRGRPPFPGMIELVITLYMPIAPSWSKKKQAAARAGLLRPIMKPDWDNQAKATCDALNGICWVDDKQVVDGRVRRFYADRPRAVVTFRELGASNMLPLQPGAAGEPDLRPIAP